MLDAWWKQNMALSTGTGPASVEQVLGFPSPVLDSMRELWQSALRHSARTAEVGIETARVQLQEDRAALQASEAALIAQATKTSLEREIVASSLIIAKHSSELAMTRTTLEAMTGRLADRDSALATELEVH